jgi:hypothetical protein
MKIIDDNFENDEYTKFIYTNSRSLPPELCKEIIEKFDESKNKYDGVTMSGVNKQIKDTKDLLMIGSEWEKIAVTLSNELYYCLKKHLNALSTKDDFKSKNNNSTVADYKIRFEDISIERFMAQKYKAREGRYVYHNDAMIDWPKNKKRFMTYLWYLNDVHEGGETTFNGEYQIKPTTGKLILFPACWTFPHCRKMPISSDKYIITGWIYTKTHS